MANRYWVGGSGTWNTTSTTNWSASSGGGSGASVPTAADNVIFDQAGTYTVTMTGALTCLDITVSAGTVTFATGTTPTLAISGSMSLLAGTVWNSTGAITFNATTTGKTVTTNGVSISGSVTFNGVGGGWTLGSALTTTSSVFVTAGTFSTSASNYAISCTFLNSSSSSTRTISLNNSTITVSFNGGAAALNFLTITNLTFNAGASQINLTGTTSGISSGGLTFYNVAFTSTTAGTKIIIGANTFNNFAVTAPSSAGLATVTFDSRQTINGTLSTTGTAGNRRVFFSSDTYGIAQTLTVNSAPSLTDADFRGIYVIGTSAPISGTRIGNRGECSGITFSTPKTVYWNLAGAQNWSANGWATTSTGVPSTDNFPLPQDTATFTNSGSVTGTITLDTAIAYVPNVDMSGRTSAMTIGTSNATTVYGNWTNGSGTAFTGTAALTFSGGGTQTITSAGKTFSGAITVDTYGGTVQLADALNIGTNTLTVTNGTFDTKNFNVTVGSLASSNTNVRTITLGSSTVTISGATGLNFAAFLNLTFNAGTSQITASSNGLTFSGGSRTFYNVTFSGASAGSTVTLTGASNTFNNLSITGPSSAGILQITCSGNQTINGTLTCAGASAVRRIFLRSDTIGTQRTLTVNSISATDCDFRDINLAGTASGVSPTRAGDCGGNAGITFSAAKTVYWNLAGAQNWSATGWCPSSGGTPDINQFPLAQDTAKFDDTGSVTGTITINAAWNIGTFDASARTSAMTLTTSTNTPSVYGDWKFGTGVTSSSTTGTITFSKPGTQTITSNGVQFGCPVTSNHPSGTVQLADALSLGATRTLAVGGSTFDAVTYNVTTGTFSCNTSGSVVKMGSGTWTLSGTGTVWNLAPVTVFAGTSTIVLSDTSTTARTFNGGGLYYNKLTIGGTTGTSTLTITGANTFGELASTKTVAHTITFPSSTTTTIGKWSVTGTVGNVVTLAPSTAATTYTLSIAGPANSGIDYLSVSYCAVSTTSPGEFYVGANSTNTAGNTGAIIFTAAPTPRTLYWVGGTGNWSATTSWSTSSGGGSGAAIPTSLDSVNFDSLSNATAYTATIDAGVTIARCAAFTMAGPLTGNVTFAGTVPIAFHGNVTFAATGITRTYAGEMNGAGNSSYTFTSNGLTFNSGFTCIGIGSTWTLGSALNIFASALTVTYGTFNTSASNYSVTGGYLSSSSVNVRSIVLNASAITTSGAGSPVLFSTTTNFTFNAGTSTLSSANSSPAFAGGGLTYYNVSFTSTAASTITVTGANTFNNLTFTGRTTVGITPVTFNANQTISGTLTLPAGTAAAYRNFLASDTIGTQRTLTVNALAAGATDVDFRDIAIAGAAAPISGTRFGDCKGNSGITFPGAKTVYWRLTGSFNWGVAGSGSWSATSGGTLDATQFPLAQDTAVFPAATYPASGSTITINANYNIGTIDMSLRTANTMTLDTGSTSPQIYGNWANGTGITVLGTAGRITFCGRGSQTITSAGKDFPKAITINTPSGSVTFGDAFLSSSTASDSFLLTSGTIDAAGYNFTSADTANSNCGFSTSGTATRTVAVGSGTWTIRCATNTWNIASSTNLTVTGTGTITLTSASAKTFAGGGANYSGITLNQGGAGALTISGNNTFKDITNTYSATGAATISLGATTTTLTQFTGTGASGKVLTLSGTSAASPATLILSSGTVTTPNYLTISNVRAYSLSSTWYAGANSTNAGSLGWIFAASGGVTYTGTISETATGTDTVSASFLYLGSISETATATDSTTVEASTFNAALTETATSADTITVVASTFNADLSETILSTDSTVGYILFSSSVDETATTSDSVVGYITFPGSISETLAASDSISAVATFLSVIAESGTATDSTVGYTLFPAFIAETATSTDSTASIQLFASTILETTTATDATSALAAFGGTILETGTATDAVNAPGSVYNPSIAETATATDSTVGYLLFPATIVESATSTDQASAFVVFVGAVAESAAGTDEFSSTQLFSSIIEETGAATDAIAVAPSVFNAPVVELVTGTDAPSASAIFPNYIVETISITDSVIGAYLWTPIDDDQTPGWNPVNDSQSVTWSAVNDSQTASWQNVNNSQSSGWVDVNDSQTPGWTPVLP